LSKTITHTPKKKEGAFDIYNTLETAFSSKYFYRLPRKIKNDIPEFPSLLENRLF